MKTVFFAPKTVSSGYCKHNKKPSVSLRRYCWPYNALQSPSDLLNVFRTRFFYTQTSRGVAPCHFFLSHLVADIVICNNHGGKINDFKAYTTAFLYVWSVRE